MHRFCLVAWALIFASSSVCSFSQEYSRADLFAGYSYLNVDTNGLSSRQSLNGWEASISGNFSRWLAAEADVSGHYKTVLGVSVSDYSYLAGPRINFKPIFVHALVGGDHLRGAVSGGSASQDGLAAAFGGGLQVKITRTLSARASGDYVLSRHNIFGGPAFTQNNFRASVGIVYSFGGASKTTSDRSVPTRITRPAISIPTFGIRVTTPEAGGAEIVDVTSGSAAALGGLRIGDVVTEIDGKPIRSTADLSAEMANHSIGSTLRIGYMIRGQWQSEKTITLH